MNSWLSLAFKVVFEFFFSEAFIFISTPFGNIQPPELREFSKKVNDPSEVRSTFRAFPSKKSERDLKTISYGSPLTSPQITF